MKKHEFIKTLSGVNTEPFNRYTSNIQLDELISLLIKASTEGERLGYCDLNVHITEDVGLVDIKLFGMVDLTEKDIKMRDRLDVFFRKKEKTTDGETRDDLLYRRNKNMEGTLHNTEDGWVVRWSDTHQYGHGYHMIDTILHPDDQEDFMGTIAQMIKWDGMNVNFEMISISHNDVTYLPITYARILKKL